MTVPDILNNTGKVVEFLIKFVIKLTANLVIELLKFGVLTLVVLGLLCGSVISLLCAVRWSYVTSDGDVFYTLCVTIGMVVLVLAAFAGLQYLVKDVFMLTKMTILEFAFFWLKPLKKCDRGKTLTNGKEKDSETEKKSL